MNYDFFAGPEDKIDILEYIFKQTDIRIFDSYSLYSEDILEYKSPSEISSRFDLTKGDKFALTFQLWSPRHKGQPLFKKIELDPRRCNGHTFRYSTNGWGLIQLYFGGIKNNELYQSHIGHFSKAGASKHESTNLFNGKVDAWDWTEIQVTSRKLKYQISSKFSVRKFEGHDVLPGAEKQRERGVKLN
jgi:hypothetical protein